MNVSGCPVAFAPCRRCHGQRPEQWVGLGNTKGTHPLIGWRFTGCHVCRANIWLAKFDFCNAISEINSAALAAAAAFLPHFVAPSKHIERESERNSELIGSLKLVDIWDFVQLIFGLHRPMNQLNKDPNIA